MVDRVATYPGRIHLTPVSGSDGTYDMTRADVPVEEGTPLNKASLLTDATAALAGLGTDAVPDDILSLLLQRTATAGTTLDTVSQDVEVIKTKLSALITYGTSDLTAGTSPLATGTIYVRYE